MLNNLRPDLIELLELVRDEATYRATLVARPEIKPEHAAEAEHQRKVLRIQQIRMRWDL